MWIQFHLRPAEAKLTTFISSYSMIIWSVIMMQIAGLSQHICVCVVFLSCRNCNPVQKYREKEQKDGILAVISCIYYVSQDLKR